MLFYFYYNKNIGNYAIMGLPAVPTKGVRIYESRSAKAQFEGDLGSGIVCQAVGSCPGYDY